MKNKRRLDEQEEELVNVLRQRFKQDEEQKQINGKLFIMIFFHSFFFFLFLLSCLDKTLISKKKNRTKAKMPRLLFYSFLSAANF